MGGKLRAGTMIVAAMFLIAATPIPNPLRHPPANQTPAEPNKHSQRADSSQKHTAPPPQPIPVVVSGRLHATTDNQSNSSNQTQSGMEKSFWDFSLTDLLLALFTAALVGVGVFQWNAMRRQEYQMRRSVIEARKAAHRQFLQTEKALGISGKSADAALAAQRPWIKIASVEPASEMKEDIRGIRLQFKVQLRNVGNSPATNLQPWVSMACGAHAYKAAFEKIPRVENYGVSLFPDEDVPVEKDLYGRVTFEEIDEAAQKVVEGTQVRPTRQIGVVVLVSVTYDFAGGIGRTTKAHWLYGPDYRGGLLIQVDFDKLPIQLEELGLMPLPVHDTAV
jgi:hypothetical protein